MVFSRSSVITGPGASKALKLVQTRLQSEQLHAVRQLASCNRSSDEGGTRARFKGVANSLNGLGGDREE